MLLRNELSLARIFHTDRDEEVAKADGVRQASILIQGCMCTYCPNQNVSLTQHPSDFPASVVDQNEISGLAFSLLEVLVALSLLAIILLGMLYLWPAAQRMSLEVEQKENAIFIAQRIIETLRATSPNGVIALSSDWMDHASHCIRVELSTPSKHVVAYDACGIPVSEMSLAESRNPLRGKNIVSLASITIARALFPGLAVVSITLASPAALPDQERHHTEFTCLVSIAAPAPQSPGELARIFHSDLLWRPGSQMNAALISKSSSGSMYTYSPASKCSPALPHQPSRPPRHDQYEISGLALRI